MNRAIKFRGKRTYNEEWIYGDLLQLGGPCIVLWNEGLGDYDYVSVLPDTVGQYTGLKDNKGGEIYEGDLIRFAETYLYIVKYEDAKFVGYHANNDWGKWGDLYKLGEPQFNKYSYVVIGNIYENPELLNPASGITSTINMQDPREQGQPEEQTTETQPETPPTQEQAEG